MGQWPTLTIPSDGNIRMCLKAHYSQNDGGGKQDVGRLHPIALARLRERGGSGRYRVRILGTEFRRRRKASGRPDPSNGRRYMRKASVTSVPESEMK